ncbi:MAG: ABC transporter ATP-binding protein [Pseudomonadota bacterium]
MLHISNLSHTYPNGVRALNGITLDVPKGMFGLLGPNGAGKSTLMRCLAALQKPSAGTMQFGAIDVLREPDALRQVLGYLPQDFGVYPRISAQAMLDHLAVLKGVTNGRERKALVAELLRQVNLYDVRKKSLAGFSGGMRQRFGVAQALIGNPQLIIVDEPTAGLDPQERNRFHNLLSEIGENVVVLLSTHIVSDVADLCANMAIIAKGTIVSRGAPSDLVAEMAGKVWQKTISKDEIETYQAKFNLLSARLIMGDTVIRIYAEENPGNGFEPVTADLEDVYFRKIFSGDERPVTQAA